MTDDDLPKFTIEIEALYGMYGRAAVPDHVIDGYWKRLNVNGVYLPDVKKAIEALTADVGRKTPPPAPAIAGYIFAKKKAGSTSSEDVETRDYHYIRPGDARCRRCLLARGEMEDGQTCPPAGRKLVPVTLPSDPDERTRWELERRNRIRPGSAAALPVNLEGYEFEG
ncbi:MAG: hypothetical protein GY953_42190 [bacterium]|nr:hypothetical protein [bacterium]